MNVKNFTVEKSVNGVQYFTVFECEAQNNNQTITNYSFLDIKTSDSVAHYRIKEQLNDDTYAYSETITIAQNFQNNLLIEQISDISNTSEKGVLSIYYSSLVAGELTYSIEDDTNTVLVKNMQKVFTGPNVLAVDFSLYSDGAYTLKMQMEEEVELVIFEKLNNQINFEVNLSTPQSNTMKN